ncbi:MAG: hypothetical protein ACTSQE_11055 [Candidatus Heimdallarchaeaceae archaeon]
MTIQMIAYGLIISAIINFFLLKNEGYKRYKRNIVVYGILSLIILVLTNFVHQWVDSMNWAIPESFPSYVDALNKPYWPNEHVQAYNASFKTYILVLLAGDLEPFFPCLATAFIGSIIGLSLAQPQPPRRLPLIGICFGIVSILVGIILLLLKFPFSIFNERPAITTYLIQLGGQVSVIMIMIKAVEYRGRANIFANRKFVRYIRKWSMVSLSIFFLEIFDILPKWFLNWTVGNKIGINFLKNSLGYGQLTFAALVGLYSMIWYDVLIRLWAKVNFTGSFEWLIIRLQSLGSKKLSPRLNVNLMMNHVNWINFTFVDKEELLEPVIQISTD